MIHSLFFFLSLIVLNIVDELAEKIVMVGAPWSKRKRDSL